MTLRHKGVRPVHDVVRINKRYYVETAPDGSTKLWTNKTLYSGCDGELVSPRVLGDLIFCPRCNEWFNKEQFKDE